MPFLSMTAFRKLHDLIMGFRLNEMQSLILDAIHVEYYNTKTPNLYRWSLTLRYSHELGALKNLIEMI